MNEDTRPIRDPGTRTRDLGLLLGMLIALAVYFMLGPRTGLDENARRLGAMVVLMACWWVTEAIPLATTALIPILAFPILGILPIDQTAAPYAHKLIFLFMGGLMLGAGLERWGAHKRLALHVILIVGTSPRRIIAGVMIAAAILSAFVSNTATAMMMLPIVLSIGDLAAGEDPDTPDARRFTTCLLLALAYGCSIGGLATLTGTPPNGFLAGFLDQEFGIQMTYARWLRFGIPLTAVLLPLSWIYLVFVALPVRLGAVPGGRASIRARLTALGRITTPELLACSIFTLTAILWITHSWIENAFSLPRVDDASIAIGGALLMFAMPVDRTLQTRVLSWKQAERIPWGILILFGGGLALAQGVTQTGLDSWIGTQIGSAGNPGELPMLGGVTTLVVFLTEITSNTATTSALLPVIAAVAEGLHIDPTLLLIAAAVGASCAFMLPVATPPNAIVFSSGRISIRQMAFAGFGLNLVCIVVITLMVWGLAPRLLSLPPSGAQSPATLVAPE